MKNQLFGCLTVILLLNGCSSKDPSSELDDSTIATVADRSISVTEFTSRMTLRSGGMTQIFAAEDKKQDLLDEMIQREIQVITAIEAGYDKDPKIIKALEKMMVTKLREEQLKKILAKITVSEDEIADYYSANVNKYTTPAMSRAAIIFFAVSDKASDKKQAEVKAKAEKVFKLAQTLPDSIKGFGALAAKYSESQASRYTGGDAGWLVQGRINHSLDDAVIKAVATLNNKGDMAFPLRGTDGYYLVKLSDKRAAKEQPLKQVSRSIRHLLQQQKYQQAEANWLRALKKHVTPITINQAVVKSIQPPPASKVVKDKQRPPTLPKG